MNIDSVIQYKPTAAEKSRVRGDLYYELEQMLGATQLSSQGTVQNALVESYLVHVRVLLDCLSTKSAQDVARGRFNTRTMTCCARTLATIHELLSLLGFIANA
jgi:hypothetical protein